MYVLVSECPDVDLLEDGIEHAEALSEEAVEAHVGALLGTALHCHITELRLLARPELNLQHLVCALLKVHRRHDRKIDGPPQIDLIRFGLVQNCLLRCLNYGTYVIL